MLVGFCQGRDYQSRGNRGYEEVDEVIECGENKNPKEHSCVRIELPSGRGDERALSECHVVNSEEDGSDVNEHEIIDYRHSRDPYKRTEAKH